MPTRQLRAGEYVTDELFNPALSFKVSDGWQRLSEASDKLILLDNPEGGKFVFTTPLHVFTPSDSSEQKEVLAPGNVDEWVLWFTRHPNPRTSQPTPVSVGGAYGQLIDVTATSIGGVEAFTSRRPGGKG